MKLDEIALVEAKTTLCQEALYLFELAYDFYHNKSKLIPKICDFEIKTKESPFVSIEGLNCAGKTTQVDLLQKIFSKLFLRLQKH